jgi:hypothetical protein
MLDAISPVSEEAQKQQDTKPPAGTALQESPQRKQLLKVVDLRQTFGMKTEHVMEGEA